jgi:hypothetical protein
MTMGQYLGKSVVIMTRHIYGLLGKSILAGALEFTL